MAATGNLERRAAQIEVRSKARRLEGYAALFGVEASIAGAYLETVAPTAFDRSLASDRDILALVDHDPSKVLARTRSKTLRLSADTRGLAFDLELPDTQAGRDVLALAERGDLGGMSFGFSTPEGGAEWQGNLRRLRSVDLHEISVVQAWPAYDGTIVQARHRSPGDIAEQVLRRRYLMLLGAR